MQKTEPGKNEQGQTVTEFALVLPILAILLFGVIQFGIVFNNYVTVTDATRAGARKAVTGRFLPDPIGAATTAVRSSAANLDQAKLGISVNPSGGFAPGTDVSVTATYPYEISLLGVVVQSGNLTSTTTERVE